MLDIQKEIRELERKKYLEATRKETQRPIDRFREHLKRLRKPPKVVRKTVLDVLPYKCFVNDRMHFIQFKEGFVEILALQGYNLNGINQDALADIVYSYRDLIKLYVFPIKILSLHTPLDTAPQQRYYQNLARKSMNPIHQQLLMENYYEMKYFSENELNKEFFVFLYAETISELIEYRDDFLTYAGNLKFLSLTPYRKKTVLFRLNNPLSKILF